MKSAEITQEKFVELIKNDHKKIMLEEYMSSSSLVYKMSNDEILVNHKGVCRICKNTADLENWLAELLKNEFSNEILYQKNPYGKTFPDHSYILIKDLLQKLAIDAEDLTSDLLIRIDDAINEMSEPESFRNEYFLHLISVVGEASNNDFNTVWNMELSSSDFNTWYPNLQYKNHRINYVVYLYEDMFLENKQFMKTPLWESYKTIEGIIKINLD